MNDRARKFALSQHTRSVLRTERWEIVGLLIPLARAVLYVVGLTPAPVTEMLLVKPVQVAALLVLGAAAAVAIAGVLGQKPIIERTGLQVLAPVMLMYLAVIVIADWRRSLVWVFIYGGTAAAAFSRSIEITQAMRITNRTLRGRDR